MNFKSYFFPVLLSSICGLQAQQISIIDFWTELPVDSVMAVSHQDTLFSNSNGVVDFGLFKIAERPVILKKQDYYPQTILYKNIKNGSVKLMPMESSAPIDVFSERPGNPLLMTPTHTTFIHASEIKEQGFNTLDKALAAQSGIFIKSYGGPGQIQSISARGMSAEQTQVFLDGIPVNSFQLGSADPGQYNLDQVESVEIYRGGNPRLGSGGTIGGAINLHSRVIPDTLDYSLKLRGETLNNQFADLTIGLPTGFLNHEFSLHYENGENEYTVKTGSEKISLTNRDFNNWNFRYRSSLPIASDLHTELMFYTYKFSGGSPASLKNERTEVTNNARISYDNNLTALHLSYQKQRYKLNLRAFLRNNWNEYIDPDSVIGNDIISGCHFNHETGLIGHGQFIISKRFLLNSGLEVSRQKAQSTAFGDKNRERYAFFLRGDYELPWQFLNDCTTQLYTGLRAESYADFGNAFLPGIGITFYASFIKVYLSGGKNFRAPTFNELYWQPGGNPGLKPEESINFEAGVEYGRSLRSFNFMLGLSAYSIRPKNQIRWIPLTSNISSPENILAVDSDGIEIEARLADVTKRFQMIANYNYGFAVKADSDLPDDPTIGKRLPFLPEENWSILLQTGTSGLQCGFVISGSSFRYTTYSNDPYDILPAYRTAGCWAGYEFTAYRQKITVRGGCENLFDKQYELTPGYPMPMRHFYFELHVTN
ncbi:MAG: TonB-dependent receptor [Calditrichaceae bacterium]|nr:TonB-dependent receptor [Calditrichaceae bacterium]RQV96204.1 MAG: TonB-dependent receptor [Calditrichota bacterium]